MQSRILATKLYPTLVSSGGGRKVFSGQRVVGYAITSGRTADPAIHSENPDEVGAEEAIRDEKLRRLEYEQTGPTTKDNDPYVHPKTPFQSTPKLEHPAVGPLINPLTQQKRQNSQSSAAMDDVSCTGLGGSPWPNDERESDFKKQREEQREDDVEYFKHHKASPLSEIEIADTRKPISKATDGTASSESSGYFGGYGGSSGDVWRPEQLLTAEETMQRASELFRMNAERGDPDSPHGRVLRELRGEYW